MLLPSFQSFPLWLNLAIFILAAAIIWFAGTRLERYTDGIAERTGLGQAFLGLLLLATATSLPELATTITATLAGNTDLAIHNLLGGVVVQSAVLAIADMNVAEGSLTGFTPKFVLLVEGVGLVVLLATAQLTMILGEQTNLAMTMQGDLLTIGLGPVALFILFLVMIYMSYRYEGRPRWQPTEENNSQSEGDESAKERQLEPRGQQRSERSLSRLVLIFGLAAVAVMVAGWAVATVGEALAVQTGLGGSFIGFTLIAIATSLPELSTTLAATNEGNYSMAISNVFGSNAFVVALLFLVALLYRGEGSPFQEVPSSAMLGATLGIILTCIYLWGLLERENRAFLRMGWDSLLVLILAIGGTVLLYFIG